VQGSFDIEAGRVVAWHAGEVPSQPGAVLTLPAADARSIVEGEEQPSVLFMQGRLKADGDMRIILAVLRATASTNYAPGRATLAESITH
jgi:predicted lipid carrier protein YhbT